MKLDTADIKTMDTATEAAADLSALAAGFRDRAKAEGKRFELATDSEYWFAVCFKSREQKEIFLRAMGWAEHGDKYLDGTKLAEAAGVPLPEVKL